MLFGAIFGAYNFVTTRTAASEISAPQLAALAAESLVVAVVPYVLARAWDEVFRQSRDERDNNKKAHV